MSGRVVVFSTHSDAEASIVCGLLDAHGLAALVERSPLRNVFPLPVALFGQLRVSVADTEGDEALRLIDVYRTKEPEHPRVVPLRDDFAPLERRLGYRFTDRLLLRRALTHRSRAHEDPTGSASDNESLEFLGDAVLGFVVADLVFREFPLADEGQKSKVKAALVSAGALARIADALDLGRYLILGRGEEKTGGRRKQALLADACEALIAAVYLDGGVEAARTLIVREIDPLLEDTRARGATTAGAGDFKSGLQEYLQARGLPPPEYRVAGETGPDHHKVFAIDVRSSTRLLASSTGRSKKDAEQEAARRALEALGDGSIDLDDSAG